MALSKSYSFNKYFNNVTIDDGIEMVDFVDDSILDYEWGTVGRAALLSEHHDNREDFVADELMDTNLFWWVLFIRNDIRDPFDGMEPGDIVVSPQRSEIFDAFEEFKS